MESLTCSQFRKLEAGVRSPAEAQSESVVFGRHSPQNATTLELPARSALPFRVHDLSGFSAEYLGSLKLRLEEKFTPEPNTGCWLWTASADENGYGFLHVGSKRDGTNRMARAHRVAFELYRGPVPEGMVLDHLCRIRCCVNPAHLEPVTFGTNILRGDAPTIVSHRLGKCLRCDSDLSVNRRGDGYCRPCSLKYHRAYDAKRPRTLARRHSEAP